MDATSQYNPQTVLDLFNHSVEKQKKAFALGQMKQGNCIWFSWDKIATDVKLYANAMISYGIRPGDRIAILSENRYEWVVADLAIHAIRAVSVPIHSSQSNEQICWQLEHSDTRILFVSDLLLISKLRKKVSKLNLAIVVFNHERVVSKNCPLTSGMFLDLFLPLRKLDSLEILARESSANDLASILYTSGTTGEPRGVMLSQGNLTTNATSLSDAVAKEYKEVRLSFLPFSHAYARTCDFYTWLYRGSQLVLVENRETILADCQAIQPDTLNGVPYFYQKVVDQLVAKKLLETPDALKNMLGGKIKRCYSGGAALTASVETVFKEQNVPLLSGYGLTETSPVVTASRPSDYKYGTVGLPLPEVELKLTAENEILVRGPNVMQGYWKNQEATLGVLNEGWLQTGDLGTCDDEGYLTITRRKKELLVLTTGKNVSPISVENKLLASLLIEQVVVFGDNRACLVALVVPNSEWLRKEIRSRRLWAWSKRRAVTHAEIVKLFSAEITRCLQGSAAEEQVRAFKILTRGFSIEQGEITPKMSLCRETIEKNFSKVIEQMYRK